MHASSEAATTPKPQALLSCGKAALFGSLAGASLRQALSHPTAAILAVCEQLASLGLRGFVPLHNTSDSDDVRIQDCQDFSENWYIGIVWRLLMLTLTLVLNSLMLHNFVLSLHRLGSVRGTSMINGISFIVSGLLGVLVFGEKASLLYGLGMVLVWIGLLLV